MNPSDLFHPWSIVCEHDGGATRPILHEAIGEELRGRPLPCSTPYAELATSTRRLSGSNPCPDVQRLDHTLSGPGQHRVGEP
jgi:hypothetical protein